jgi:hypothetical protein
VTEAALVVVLGVFAMIPADKASAQPAPDRLRRISLGGAGPPGLLWPPSHSGASGTSGAERDQSTPILVRLPVLRLDAGLDPVGLGDIADYGGTVVPRSVRQRWLDAIARGGREVGVGYASLAGRVDAGRTAFTVEVEAFAEADLTRDAAELLLFGNAGRAGEAAELEVVGSALRALATTSVGVARGWEISGEPGTQTFSLEARTRWVIGNGLLYGVGVQGGTSADPPGVDLRFPVVETLSDAPFPGGATGLAFDVALIARDEAGRWEAGAAVRDLVSTFRLRSSELSYRPGTALFDADNADTDFGRRPVAGADLPEEVRAVVEEVEALRFHPVLELGVSWKPTAPWEIAVGMDRTRYGGIRAASANGAAVGVGWAHGERLELRGGARRANGANRWSLGAGVWMGPVYAEGAWARATRRGGSAETLAVSLTLRR